MNNNTLRKFTSNSELQDFFENDTLNLEKGSIAYIAKNVIFQRNIFFSGKCILHSGSEIHQNCFLKNVKLQRNNIIKFSSYISDCFIGMQNSIGPFSYLRENVIIGKFNIIGAHTEITRSNLKNYNKISHFSFIGDCKLGNSNIIGAGVVTANYKSEKHKGLRTEVKNNTMIGSNSTIIAPCKIESNVIIGAGSKILFDVKKNKKIIQKID